MRLLLSLPLFLLPLSLSLLRPDDDDGLLLPARPKAATQLACEGQAPAVGKGAHAARPRQLR
jgi:hypothetical protein